MTFTLGSSAEKLIVLFDLSGLGDRTGTALIFVQLGTSQWFLGGLSEQAFSKPPYGVIGLRL